MTEEKASLGASAAGNQAPFPGLRTAYLRAIAKAWNDKDFYDKLRARSNDDALPLLEQEFRFKFPFDIKFYISFACQPQWTPEQTGGWLATADKFKLYLPGEPTNPQEADAVLTRYYEEFPSLLGRSPLATAPDDFANFGVTTMRLVALTWANDSFSKELYAAKDARGLIQDALDVLVPWNFQLQLGKFNHPELGEKSDLSSTYWAEFPRSEITVNFPEAPDHKDTKAVALAAYNATGAQYPFSCG
jgi:ribosomally synthesized peptide (two-chain TOMM family)